MQEEAACVRLACGHVHPFRPRLSPPPQSPTTDNIYNKKALNLLGKNGEGHWALAAGQLLVGACFVIPQWLLGVRAKPGACVCVCVCPSLPLCSRCQRRRREGKTDRLTPSYHPLTTGLSLDQWKALAPIGVFNAAAHGASVLALGAGAVSFGQIVKAGEPVHAALTGTELVLSYRL